MDLDKIFKNDPLYKTPWLVLIISSLVILNYFLINITVNFSNIDNSTFSLFGAPDTINIYQGQFWGILSNNFIHTNWAPLLFNIIGLWLFGAFIERRIGYLRFLYLLIIASIIPSLWQLTMTTEAGIGLAGVNYTLFGYILVRSKKGKAFKLEGLYYFLILMISVLIYCNYINIFEVDKYRTESMIIGFLLGLLLARIRYGDKKKRIIIISSICLISVSTLFYAPWSSVWHVFKGIQCYEKGDVKNAKMHYNKSLKLEPRNKLALDNLRIIKIGYLIEKAYNAHLNKKYLLAKKYYLDILKIDPSNQGAKENLAALP